MQKNSSNDTSHEKFLARKRYAERKFDKWAHWSFRVNGKIKYKDIIEMQKEFNLINK